MFGTMENDANNNGYTTGYCVPCRSFSKQELDRLVAVAITTAEAALMDEPDYDRPTNEADLEAIGRGLQDVAEGRVIPGDVALAQFREQFRIK